MTPADPVQTGPLTRGLGPLLREWLVVLTLLALIVTGLSLSGALLRLDKALYDLTVRRTAAPVPEQVLIVAIDDASLERLGPWPWPDSRHAELIERLAAAGVASIGYDVSTEDGGGVMARAAARAEQAGVRVAMPVKLRIPGPNGRPYQAELPPEGVRWGHGLFRPDGDGVVRQVDLAVDGQERWPLLAALVAGPRSETALAQLAAFVPEENGQGLSFRGQRLIGFRGPPGSLRSLPAMAVLAGEAPAELLQGRSVLVGLTAAGLGARYATSVSGQSGAMTEVEIQASLVADLMQGRTLVTAGGWRSLGLAMVMLWMVMVGMLMLRPGVAAVFGIMLMALLLAVTAAGLAVTGQWVAPGAAVVALLVAPPVWAWRRLAVVNDWMTRELTALGDMGLPRRKSRVPSDPVTRTTEMLAATIDRVEELRRLADAALRGLPDATVLVGNNGQIAAANGAAEALFGTDPTVETVDAAFAGNELPAFGAETLASSQSAWRGEFVARDGSVRDVRFTPWRNSRGEPLGWIVRFADISALRRAEAAREEALQLLTHDMRAPQASILALVEGNAELQPETAERLRQLARRTIGLADGYLQLARAEAGNYAMDEVDLAAIATEAVDEMWPQAQAKGVRLEGLGLDEEALLWGNHSLLMRAIVNLLGNALKFSPEGSRVLVVLRPDSGDWRLDVEDQGPGVPAALQPQLFGRFRTGGTAGGVGLGLAFVRSVAEGHGGHASCRSVPGEGATFSLWLPGLAAGRKLRSGGS